MPNTKSAIRRTKRTQQQALVNRIRKSKYKSANKKMSFYLETGKMKEATNYLPKLNSQLMKIAKTGVVSKKTAYRKISKVNKKINKEKTIQYFVDKAISKVANHKGNSICGGRTDTGVHAFSQIIHFDTTSRRSNLNWTKGINTFLPNDIIIKDRCLNNKFKKDLNKQKYQ